MKKKRFISLFLALLLTLSATACEKAEVVEEVVEAGEMVEVQESDEEHTGIDPAEFEALLTGKFVKESYKNASSETEKLVLKIVQMYLGKGLENHPAETDRDKAETYLRMAYRFMVYDDGYSDSDVKLTVEEMAAYLSKIFCLTVEKAEEICRISGRIAEDGYVYMYGEDLGASGGVYEYILHSIDYDEENEIMTIVVDFYNGPYYLETGEAITEEAAYQSEFLKEISIQAKIYPDGTFGYLAAEWSVETEEESYIPSLPQTDISTEIQITDEMLEERVMHLLDPYILPVAWWTGGEEQVLDMLRNYNKPAEVASGYEWVFRFNSIEEMKLCTEQVVTAQYAETYLYPLAAENLYFEYDGRLYWNTKCKTEMDFLRPQSARLLSRDGGAAELMVDFEDGSRYQVEMLLEDGVWKLNSTPYFESEWTSQWLEGKSEAQISDEELEKRAVSLLDYYVLPNYWWLVGGSADTLFGDLSAYIYETVDLPVAGETKAAYCPLTRFESIEELKRSTEQIVTKEYAETNLYPWGDTRAMFIERNGRLYGNTYYEISPGIGDAKSAELLERNGDTAILNVEFYTIDATVYRQIEMKLEDGIWKLNSTQLDFYFDGLK